MTTENTLNSDEVEMVASQFVRKEEEKPKKVKEKHWWTMKEKTQDSIIRWTRLGTLVLLITLCLGLGYQVGYEKSEDSYWVIARGCQNGKVEPREWQPNSEDVRSVYFVCVQK
jgi:hypothetical protein